MQQASCLTQANNSTGVLCGQRTDSITPQTEAATIRSTPDLHDQNAAIEGKRDPTHETENKSLPRAFLLLVQASERAAKLPNSVRKFAPVPFNPVVAVGVSMSLAFSFGRWLVCLRRRFACRSAENKKKQV